MREFETGATRDDEGDKPDYEGFFSPQVFQEYGRRMTNHRVQADGKLRASDNWQKGIPRDVYIKSAFRHFVDWWEQHRNPHPDTEVLKEALCCLIFNASGYLHEYLKSEDYAYNRDKMKALDAEEAMRFGSTVPRFSGRYPGQA